MKLILLIPIGLAVAASVALAQAPAAAATSPAFALDTRSQPAPLAWQLEKVPPLRVAAAFAGPATIYGLGRPDGARIKAYPDGVTLALAWVGPPKSAASFILKWATGSALGWVVEPIKAKANGAVEVTITRGSWSRCGPVYLEALCQGEGLPAGCEWRSEPFLLVRPDDSDAAIADGVAALNPSHPAWNERQKAPPPAAR